MLLGENELFISIALNKYHQPVKGYQKTLNFLFFC